VAEQDYTHSKEAELIKKAQEALFNLRVRCTELGVPVLANVHHARTIVSNIENVFRFKHKEVEGFSERSKSV